MSRILALLIFLPFMLLADTIPGQDSAKFQDTLALWLKGEDAQALPAFSELANDGNAAAQIFLGQLEPLIHLHDHITADLPREDRIALLRNAEGLSGKSWLESAKNQSALAGAFLNARRINQKADAIPTLLEYGEQQSALLPLISLSNEGKLAKLSELQNNPDITGAARAYLSKTVGRPLAIGSPQKTARTKSSSDDILLQTINLPNQTGPNKAAIILAEHMSKRPEYTPIRDLCEATCADRNRCVAGLVATMWGEPAWIKLASPVESLLSSHDYHQSPRMRADLKRRITMQPLYKSGWLQNYDQCTYQAVQTPKPTQ